MKKYLIGIVVLVLMVMGLFILSEDKMLYSFFGLCLGIMIGGLFVEPLAGYIQKRAKELANNRRK